MQQDILCLVLVLRLLVVWICFGVMRACFCNCSSVVLPCIPYVSLGICVIRCFTNQCVCPWFSGHFCYPSFINQCASHWFPGQFCYPFHYKPMCFPMVPLAFSYPFPYKSMCFPVVPWPFSYPFLYKSMCFPVVPGAMRWVAYYL